MVALDPTKDSSLEMSGASTISASDCAIYSNSNSLNGISIVSGARMNSSSTYSGGGFDGPFAGYQPRPVTDSPPIDDPLIDRAGPSVGKCDYSDVRYKSQTLDPGVYCGGITTKGKTTLTLNPGTYIIKDGPLSIGGNSTLAGDGVGFYFIGNKSTFDFGVSTQLDLGAPTSGDLAGILFFEDRKSPKGRDFVIRSKDAERLEGAVYLPKGKLIVDKASRIGQLSDWTAIIAKQIEIKEGPNLQINSDYANSTIPVPAGIGPSGTTARLTK